MNRFVGRVALCVMVLAGMCANAMPLGVRTMLHARAAMRQVAEPVRICYTVTYAPGKNGTGEQQTATKTNDVALVLKGAIFSRTGYKQTGWAMSDGGANAYDLGASYTVNAAATLYPVWAANSYSLAIRPNSAKYGTVTGGGTYAVGVKATIKATAKKGYVFAGWFTDKACTKALNPKGYDNRKPTVKYAMPAKNATVYAKFVTKAEDKKALKFKSATKKLATTPAKATAGAAFSLKLGVSSASLPTFTAKGLPKGLSIDKITGEITGVGTVPGTFTATVTVKSAAGNTVTQKVKITVNVPSWAKGTFYGTAGIKSEGTWAYVKFTVGSTGKVTGKVTYKGKGYSFTSAYKSCTATKATFAPKAKVGSYTLKPGTATVKKRTMNGLTTTEALASGGGGFYAQKKPNLVKKGKPLATLVGETFTFTKKDANSGLTKSKDKLAVKLGNGDVATVSGTVKGKALKALSWAVLASDKETVEGVTTYTLYVDIVDAALKYAKTLVITATDGPNGVKATAAFAK